jgi:hypothetical protein
MLRNVRAASPTMAKASTAGKPRVTSATEAPRRERTPSAEVVALRPPAWDWAFFEDGALALERHDLWEEPPEPSTSDVSQTPATPSRLKRLARSATVARMPSARAPRAARRARRRANRRVQRVAILVIVASIVLVTATLTAFGSSPAASTVAVPAPIARLAPDTPPRAQIVAMIGSLRLQLPVTQGRLTALGYHATPSGALSLEPLGRQGNRGVLRRAWDWVFGTPSGDLVWYRLDGGRGPDSSVLDVGAPTGTTVFSPVDGTVVGITDYVLNARPYGVRIDIQPSSAPSYVVSLTRLRADPDLTVGTTVAAGRSKLGAVLDLSGVERQALARFSEDAGNHVSLEVHPAATLALP